MTATFKAIGSRNTLAQGVGIMQAISNPSNYAIAAESGIVPHSPGWKKACAKARSSSKLQAEFEAGKAANLAELATGGDKLAERESLEACGAAYLIGAQIIRSKRGTYAAVFGNRASPISAKACEATGRTPGPGND